MLSEKQNLKNQIAMMDAILMILSYTPHPILGDCHKTSPYAELRRCKEYIKDQLWILERQEK
jgi:hypothetical protein